MAAVLIGAAFAAVYAALLISRRTREPITTWKLPIRIAGAIMLLAAFLILVPGLSLLPESTWPVLVNAMPVMVLVGLALIMLPGVAERMPAQIEASKAAALVAGGEFVVRREVLAAIAAPFVEPSAFIRIAGPWLLACWALTAMPLQAAAATGSPSTEQASQVLLSWAAATFLSFLAIVVVALAWQRFVLRRELPRFIALPGPAVLSGLWRLWLVLVFVGVSNQGAQWLAARVSSGVSEDLTASLLGLAATFLALVLTGTTWGLAFPAIAEGRKVPFSWVPMVGQGVPWLSAGLAFTAAPFLIAGSLILHIGQFDDGGFLSLILFAEFVLLFAGVAACGQYLARVYEAFRSQIELTLAS